MPLPRAAEETAMAEETANHERDVLHLALRPREAAQALSIGERLLWSKTNAGEIPHVRIGRAVVYPVDLLRDWLVAQARKGVRS